MNEPPPDLRPSWNPILQNSLFFAVVLIGYAVGVTLLLMLIDWLFKTGDLGGNWIGIGVSFAAAFTAGYRFASRNGGLPLLARKRLAIAYTTAQLLLSAITALGLAALGLLPQGLSPLVWMIIIFVGVLLGGGIVYLISGVALAQTAKVLERQATRRAA